MASTTQMINNNKNNKQPKLKVMHVEGKNMK